MTNKSRDIILELVQARQNLANAQAQVAALEAAVSPTDYRPSKLSLFSKLLKQFDLRVSVGYAIIASCWIVFSDQILARMMSQDLSLSATYSVIKGLVFVWLTAIALFSLLHAELRKRGLIEAALEHDLIRRQQAEENITKLNRTLGVLSDINQTIIRTRHIPTLYENACNIAVEKGAFRMAWIGLLDSKTQRIIPVAHAGFTDDYLEKLNIALNDEVRGYGPTGKAIRSGQHVIVSDIEHDPMMQPWRDDARRLNYGSLAALPLTVAGEVRGALNLYASESHFFDDAEFRVVDEMAGDISFAMEFAEQDVQRKQTEATLLESERRYHRMLDDLLEGAEIIGFDWRYLYVNEASASHGRMSKEVLLKGTVLELYPGIENTDLFACLRTCMEDRTPQHFENEFVFPDGATTWFELSVQPVPEGIFILSLDITERKRSEIALQRYTKRMEILYEIDNGLIQGTSVKALIQATLIHLSQLIPCQQANVTLIDPITGEGQTFAHDLSHDSFFTEGVPFTLPDNIYGRDDDKHVQIFDDIRPFQDSSPRVKQLVGEGWVSLLRAALTDQDNPLGSLVLVADTPHYFDTEYQEIAAQVAGQLAIAIRQFQLSAELYKSETRYRRVVEDQTDLICRYNSDYTLTFVNEAYASIYNKRAGELIGMNFFELMAEADRAYSKVYLSTLSASNPVASTEHRSLLPDGTERWIQWTDRALLDSAGNITEYQGVGRDITDRKRAEEAVNRQNAILHQSRDLIALSDLEGRISYINASGAALMGFQSAQAAYGTVISDYYTPDDMHCIVTRYLPEALETGNWRGENRLKTITGSLIDVDQTIFPIRDDMGNLQYYATIMVDITGRKQAEETLRKSEARQRAMLTAIPDIMFRYRGDGTFLEYHAPHAELLATPPEIFLGKKTTEVLPLELAESLLNRIKHVVETKEPVQMEYTLEVPSGMREFESRMVSVGEDEVLAIVRDVTERKLAERELQSLYNATSYLFKADSLLGLGRQIVAAVIREFEHVDCGIMLLDKSKSNILRLARTGRSDIHPDIPLQLNGPGLVPMALRTGEVVYVPDVTQNTHYVSSEDTTQTEFVIPLKTTNGIIGALDMQHTRKDAFSDRDRRILTAYAERAAPAIEIMQLYDELNRHAADLEWRVAQRTVELNYAKERAEAILNHSADGIILLDSNMIIEQTNLAFNDIFAAPDDAYFGRPFTDLLVDEEKERINQIFLKGNLDKKGQRLETRARRKDGTAFDAELGIGFIKKRGQVCIIRDITDRKQAEKAIAEERNLLRTLIDALPDYIYVKDTNHKTLLSNLARTHSFGLESPEETIGKDDYDFVPAELVAQYHIDEDRLFQTLEPLIDHEERGVGLTGDLIWASTTKVPLHNLNGELIGLVGVTRDISDRKLREQQLRFDAGIQASVSDAVIVTDMDFRIQSWNKAAVSIYGWTTNEVLGKSIVEILRTRFESAEAENHDRVLLFSEHQLQGEFMQQRKDGTELYTQSSTTVFKDESGIPIGIISVNRDITERKKAEQALRESEIRFRSLFASAPIATVITDQQGQITLINQQAENVFGYSAQELIGRPIEILLPAQVRDYHPILRASYIADPRIRGMGPLKELNALRKMVPNSLWKSG